MLSHCNSHAVLRYSVHAWTDHWDIQLDMLTEVTRQIDLIRKEVDITYTQLVQGSMEGNNVCSVRTSVFKDFHLRSLSQKKTLTTSNNHLTTYQAWKWCHHKCMLFHQKPSRKCNPDRIHLLQQHSQQFWWARCTPLSKEVNYLHNQVMEGKERINHEISLNTSFRINTYL